MTIEEKPTMGLGTHEQAPAPATPPGQGKAQTAEELANTPPKPSKQQDEEKEEPKEKEEKEEPKEQEEKEGPQETEENEEPKEKKEKKEKKDKKDKKEKKHKKEKKEKEASEDDKPRPIRPPVVQLDRRLDMRNKFKEGQRHLTPPIADATRAFYESLLQENPRSKIAIKFIVEHGVLPLEEHKKLLSHYHALKASTKPVATQAAAPKLKKRTLGGAVKKDVGTTGARRGRQPKAV